MKIEITEVKEDKLQILNRLLQLYLHNISLYFPINIDSNTGLYEYDNINKYINNLENKAFFITDDTKIAGFIFVDFLENKNIVQEMFILNNYKRKSIGKTAVKYIFERFKGNWEIKSLPCYKDAEKFWISVIKEYTNDSFNLEYIGKFNRAVLNFNNKNNNFRR